MIGSGYCLRNTTLFSSLRSLTHLTVLSFLGVIKVGEPHSLAPVGDSTPMLTRRSNSFLKAAKWILGTGYGLLCFLLVDYAIFIEFWESEVSHDYHFLGGT